LRRDPFSLARKARPIHVEAFTDPDVDDRIVLALRQLDVAEYNVVTDIAEAKRKFYLGDAEEEIVATPFPPVGGEIVTLSQGLCFLAARLVVMQQEMQVPDPDDSAQNIQADIFDFERWVAVAVTMPEAWKAINRRASEVQRGGSFDPKKD